MHRRARPLLAALLVLATLGLLPAATAPAPALSTPPAADCGFPVTVTDASGTAVTVDAPPDRVVALHPSAAQTLWEIGARDLVVGMPVNDYTRDLEGSRSRTNVVGADDFTVDVETVVALEPDLVVAPNVTPVDAVASLRRAGLAVYHVREARTIEDVAAKTARLGRLTGRCGAAEARASWMRSRIDRVRSAVADEPRPTVLYPLGGGVVPGSGTFLHEVITTAGGRNLAAEAGVEGYRQLSAEAVLAGDPQWLILNEGVSRSTLRMDVYGRTTAGRANQTVRVNPNDAGQPAPRVVYAVETIARALHPGAMARAGEAAPPTTTTGTTSPGQPGFGLAAGLVALAVALLALSPRRRP